MSTVATWSRIEASANFPTLHPENALSTGGKRSVHGGGDSKPQHGARFGRVDDSIVPKPRRAVVRAAFASVLVENRLLESGFFLLIHRLLRGEKQLIVFDGDENA